ncbi:MAG: hypothetical protein WCH34_17845 [Bacteroidota bacterium]
MNISHTFSFEFSQLINVIKRLPNKEKLVLFEILKEDASIVHDKQKLSEKLKGSISKERAIELNNEIQNNR